MLYGDRYTAVKNRRESMDLMFAADITQLPPACDGALGGSHKMTVAFALAVLPLYFTLKKHIVSSGFTPRR